MAVAETIPEAAAFLRWHGLIVACTVKRNTVSNGEADPARPLFLVTGGEKRGISRALVESAGLLLHIPYGRRFAASRGTIAAAAVMGV